MNINDFSVFRNNLMLKLKERMKNHTSRHF